MMQDPVFFFGTRGLCNMQYPREQISLHFRSISYRMGYSSEPSADFRVFVATFFAVGILEG